MGPRRAAIGVGLTFIAILAAVCGVQAALKSMMPDVSEIVIGNRQGFSVANDPGDDWYHYKWLHHCSECPPPNGWTLMTWDDSAIDDFCQNRRGKFKLKVEAWDEEFEETDDEIREYDVVGPNKMEWWFVPKPLIARWNNPVEIRFKLLRGTTLMGQCVEPTIGERIYRTELWDNVHPNTWVLGAALEGAYYWNAGGSMIHDVKIRPIDLAYQRFNPGSLWPPGTVVDECFQQVYIKYPHCCSGWEMRTAFAPIKITTKVESVDVNNHANGTYLIEVSNVPQNQWPAGTW